jgi:ornithine carbamoyltransferase
MELLNSLSKGNRGHASRTYKSGGWRVTSEVADSNQSIILNQVENGVAIRMAVIYLLASKIKP